MTKPTKATGRYADDPRVDRFMYWAMAGAAALLIAGTGWLGGSMVELGDSVAALTLEVAVMRVERKGEGALLRQEILTLAKRVSALEKP